MYTSVLCGKQRGAGHTHNKKSEREREKRRRRFAANSDFKVGLPVGLSRITSKEERDKNWKIGIRGEKKDRAEKDKETRTSTETKGLTRNRERGKETSGPLCLLCLHCTERKKTKNFFRVFSKWAHWNACRKLENFLNCCCCISGVCVSMRQRGLEKHFRFYSFCQLCYPLNLSSFFLPCFFCLA